MHFHVNVIWKRQCCNYLIFAVDCTPYHYKITFFVNLLVWCWDLKSFFICAYIYACFICLFFSFGVFCSSVLLPTFLSPFWFRGWKWKIFVLGVIIQKGEFCSIILIKDTLVLFQLVFTAYVKFSVLVLLLFFMFYYMA